MHPTTRFSNRADDYRLYRPSYPRQSIDAILENLGDPTQLTAADIGAGTGISARLLADRGMQVIAIEPNEAMRAAADPHPRITWRAATAEQTNLPDNHLDLILCAQSFHWFDPDPALREFARILKPRARLALMWNDRDLRDAPTLAYTEALRRAAAGDLPDERWRPSVDALRASALFEEFAERDFPFEQPLDEGGLIGRAMSASYAPRSGPAHDRLIEDLRTVFRTHRQPGGRFILRYRTLVYPARRSTKTRPGSSPRPFSE